MRKEILLLILLGLSVVYSIPFSNAKVMAELYIKNRTFPGVSMSVFTNETLLYRDAVGTQTYLGDHLSIPLQNGTLFDMASLTKVISTTSAVMKLFEAGKIQLNDLMIKYLPEANNHGKGNITIENLLLHNAGLPPDYPGNIPSMTKDSFIQWMLQDCAVEFPIGTKMVYSDLSMIFLQLIIENITGMQLNEYVKQEIFDPLEFKFTGYLPNPLFQAQNRCQPTQNDLEWRVQLMRCVVQDPTAYILGGVSGNAGLFSVDFESERFMQMMLNKGVYNNSKGKLIRIFNESTVNLFTTRVEGLPYQNTRALGWDTPGTSVPQSCGQKISPNSFGHTGWTGTMVWGDKDNNVGFVVLDNRVYPQATNTNSLSNTWFRNNVMVLFYNALQINSSSTQEQDYSIQSFLQE